jgi:methionyl-tRNA formyltransferase
MLAARLAAARAAGLAARAAPPPPAAARPLTSLLPLAGGALAAPRAPGSRPAAGRVPSLRAHTSSAAADAGAGPAAAAKRKLVFLGTPDVAALVLRRLLAAATAPGAAFEVAAVVAQPGRPRGRGRAAAPSPVEAAARAAGLADAAILTPEKAGDPAFLAALRAIGPDLCVTAAYGNYLPGSFLRVPRHGTLNVHPSLLPRYRGAAPVQRALADGLAASGVSVLFTTAAMDAGPLAAQAPAALAPDARAPEVLDQLFELGSDLLLSVLDDVWAGRLSEATAAPQDGGAATHALKVGRAEGLLDFRESATACHNRARAFAGWPGARAAFEFAGAGGAAPAPLELKVLRTRVAAEGGGGKGGAIEVEVAPEALRVPCAGGGVLELLEVQAPGRKPVAARDFGNGLRGSALRWRPPAKAE